MSYKKHMRIEERIKLEGYLNQRKTFSESARLLGRSKATISREVKKHGIEEQKGCYGRAFNDCLHRKNCLVIGNCGNKECKRNRCAYCKDGCGKGKCYKYEREICPILEKPPYVCNGCTEESKCTLTKIYYKAAVAQKKYKEVLIFCRNGVSISEEEAAELGKLIAPLVNQGHSIYAVSASHGDKIMYSQRTLYTYSHMGILQDVQSAKFPRFVRYKKRKNTVHEAVKVDKACRIGRTYEDYKTFLEEQGDIAVSQMDTVEGLRSEKPCLLTLHIVEASFQIALLREDNTSFSAKQAILALRERIGDDAFTKLFPVILTDNGSEFSDPLPIECNAQGMLVSRIFYCDSRQSQQKGSCENNHEFIRRILPKGASFMGLTQEKVNLMMSHINSYPRAQLGGKSPYQMLTFMYGEEILKKLGLEPINIKDIQLKPSLLK